MEVINEELLHKQAEEAALSHYGVLGMKWGKRKERPAAKMGSRRAKREENRKLDATTSTSYYVKNQIRDRRRLGQKGVRNINRSLKTGSDYKTARRAEARRQFKNDLIGGLGGVAVAMAPLFALYGLGTILQGAEKKKAADGAKMAANLFADSKGLTSYETISLAFGPNAGGKNTWRL